MDLEHVGLYVSDIEASKAFYLDGLGFSVEREFTSGDGVENAFVGTKNGATIQLRYDPGNPSVDATAGSFDHLAVTVEDVEREYDRLVARPDCAAVSEPREGHGAPAIAFVADPDGYRIELLER